MNKLSYEVMDVTELENVMGGSEIKYVGCVITNGKCSTDGGCGSVTENVMVPLIRVLPILSQ